MTIQQSLLRALLFMIFTLCSCLVFAESFPDIAKSRIGVDGGVVIPPVSEIGEQIGLGTGGFRVAPGFIFGLCADYNLWEDLGIGIELDYGQFFFPDIGADEYIFLQISASAFWSFNLKLLKIEPGISIGLSQVFLTNVQNNIFALATGTGSLYPFIAPHASLNTRFVFPINNLLGVQILLRGNFTITQDIVIPLIYMSAGIIFSFGPEPERKPEPEPVPAKEPETELIEEPGETDIILNTETPVFIGTIYFYPNTAEIRSGTEMLESTITALKKKHPDWKLKIILKGFAVPIGPEAELVSLIKDRIKAVKILLHLYSIQEGFINAGIEVIGKSQLLKEELWPSMRKVEVYFQLLE